MAEHAICTSSTLTDRSLLLLKGILDTAVNLVKYYQISAVI